MIYYLAQAYSGQEDAAFFAAIKWTAQLRLLNCYVFSPIMHNHQFHREIYCNARMEYINPDEDYVAWDLALLEAMCLPLHDVCDHVQDVQSDGIINCEIYQKRVVMLFAPTCFHYEYDRSQATYKMKDGTDKIIKNTDLPEDIFNSNIKDGPFYDKMLIWDSKGAQREYEFAQDHHIKCLLLEPFLAGKEVLF
jgi:hypothetical protein